MSTSQSPQARLLDERTTADLNAQNNLSQEVLEKWDNCRSSHRFMAFERKRIVAYTLMFETPQVIDTFTCVGFDAGLRQGVSSLWESQNGGKFWVSAAPVLVADSCFMWMLKHTQLEYADHRGVKSLRFSMGYRTLKNPEIKTDGVTYLLEEAVFNRQFKQ